MIVGLPSTPNLLPHNSIHVSEAYTLPPRFHFPTFPSYHDDVVNERQIAIVVCVVEYQLHVEITANEEQKSIGRRPVLGRYFIGCSNADSCAQTSAHGVGFRPVCKLFPNNNNRGVQHKTAETDNNNSSMRCFTLELINLASCAIHPPLPATSSDLLFHLATAPL